MIQIRIVPHNDRVTISYFVILAGPGGVVTLRNTFDKKDAVADANRIASVLQCEVIDEHKE